MINTSYNRIITIEQKYRNYFYGLYRSAHLSLLTLPDWNDFNVNYKKSIIYLKRFVFSHLLRAETACQKISNTILIRAEMIVANEVIIWCYFLLQKDVAPCIENLKLRQIYIKMHENRVSFATASKLSIQEGLDPWGLDLVSDSAKIISRLPILFRVRIVGNYQQQYGSPILHELKPILKDSFNSDQSGAYSEYFGTNWKQNRFKLFCRYLQFRQAHEKLHYWSHDQFYIRKEYNFIHCVLSKKKQSPKYIGWKNITMQKQCENCFRKDIILKKCKKCRKSYYCSVKCQKKHWKKKHKIDCSNINEIRTTPGLAYLALHE